MTVESSIRHPKVESIELFDEFFESGMEESISPFLTPSTRKWGINLELKSSILAAALLLSSFLFSHFTHYTFLSQLLLLLTFFFAGIPALIGALEDLFSFEINIDILMTLAAFLSVLIGSGQEGALLLVLFSFSGALEESVRTKAKQAISSIKQLAPSKAFVLMEDGSVLEKSVKDIEKGAHLLIKAGQIVPLDGIVIDGASSVNLIHLTGENMPIPKFKGDEVAAGARNLEGSLVIEVTHKSADSTLARIIKLITQAQEAKPKAQRWLDQITQKYAITIISLAFVFAASFPFIFSIPFFGPEGSIYRALAFLIAASPCALIIAIPIAYLSAISACAKKGILLKGGIILDELASCTQIALDKTGTLTVGELVCTQIDALGSLSLEEGLTIAYGLEKHAVHPVASAITHYAEDQKILPAAITQFEFVPGLGLKGMYRDLPVFIGNEDYLLPKIPAHALAPLRERLQAIRHQGLLFTILLVGDSPFLFQFKDRLRSDMKETLFKLKSECGMHLVMLTGDRMESAKAIAEDAGIDEYYAHLRPEDKLQYVTYLVEKGKLAMVGDGINDAPALARATVGISMGKRGSSTAIDASDIVLLQDNIELLSWLVKKARSTVKIVRENLSIALLAILVATTPALLGWIPLWLAVLLHEGGTVLVGLNALRLLRK